MSAMVDDETHVPPDVVGRQHVLAARDANRANMFVVDPRFTRTAAHATEHVRIRPGTDTAVLLALPHTLVAEGLADDAFLATL